jgi:putative sigma-54 modulation protein
MKIAVRFLGLPPSEALREHSERQALFHLSRFGQDLDSVEIRIRDVNGPRGGEDMECKVSAQGPRVGFASIADLSGDAYASVGMALSRLSRSIARALDRARGMRGLGLAQRMVH